MTSKMLRQSFVSSAFAMSMLGMFACNSDKIVTVTRPDIATFYWSLTTDIHAATVQVGGHQQLTVTPRTVSGTPLEGLGVPTFTSSDTTKVKVDDHGLVTGAAVTLSPVPVVAALTADGVTYVDTTLVSVTAGSATLESIAIEIPPGGAVLGLGDPPTMLLTTAYDDQGNPIPGAIIALKSLEPGRILLFPNGGGTFAQTGGLGKAKIIASATVYGTTRADTVEFTVQYGMNGFVQSFASYPSNVVTFSPSAIVIGVGGSVRWFNSASEPVNVTFDNDVDNIVGGDIAEIGPFADATRTFVAVGTYNFTNSFNGEKGSIIVREQPTL